MLKKEKLLRFALKLFYLDNYEGFQRQPGKETIEGHLDFALRRAGLIQDLQSADYASAGRTDKGVHAIGQVIAISTQKKPIIPAINAYLPKKIVVWALAPVNKEFHPRYDALSRYYRYYTIYRGEDLEKMNKNAMLLEGIHDFRLFSKKRPGTNTIREIYQIRIEKKDSLLIFHVIANSFLWQMVRRIIDALLKVGKGEWYSEDIEDLLKGAPKANIFTTPRPVDGPGALILWNIEYPFAFQYDEKGLTLVKQLLQKCLIEFSLKTCYSRDSLELFERIPK
ncbi:MAG: tRNA pseudouridine(38-40) synthase TruA [Candidatus Helarchaeota archaeon]